MPRPVRAPTLKEIAERAGVHISTASRVLRQDEPVDGWSESARRVLEVAAELGYQRNVWAASLRTRKTTTLGVVMPRLIDGVVAMTYQGIEEAATRAGYSVLLSSPPDDPEAQRRAAELLLGRQVDGLLLSSVHAPGRAFVAALPLGGVPVLTVTRHADAGLPFVVGDDRLGGTLAARHLLARGYTDLAVIAGPAHATTAGDRVHGFLDTVTTAGVPIAPERVVASSFDVDGGVQAARALLDRPDRPRAVFAVSDTIAIGVLGVARDLGLAVPDEVALIGYNDIPVAAQLPVALTTIASPARDIGATAVRQLLELVNGREAESVRLPVELVVRGTT
ncbi:LacI family DNA-binding transcriptional regulator [Nocardia neocaledoniensis]|uniref:LacI family DNA-binding transcriptional regulator n=1 Tax=Nocardia neocaledoniensis TaxID=236511 RepID=UPI0024554FE9|nr:LacI family DNA-binding transcriptional regulator [Nocardia neocaledoniensis]